MPAPPTSSLDRLHRLLVASLRERGADALERPFTIAEIYQDLVPYRRHRDDLAVEMNGDYEHLLLRFLSGEGGYVQLEFEPALRAIRKELEASNPSTGVYRDYAAADVRLLVREAAAPDTRAAGAGDAGAASAVEPPADEPAPVEPAGSRGATTPAPAPETCRWCEGPLPDRPGLRFCPHCGRDVQVVPCSSCGEALEPEWRFCIKCGQNVASA